MAIPGYRLSWYRNPALGALAVDTVLASCAGVAAYMALLARGGPLVSPQGAIIVLAFASAVAKAALTWKDKGKTRAHQGLEGCLHTLQSVLLASSETDSDPGLRLTIHTPVKSATELEQVLDYVSSDPKRRTGAGRRFMQQCGILGDAYRTGEVLVAVREQEGHEEYIKELVTRWHYSEDQARKLSSSSRSFMAVPLVGSQGVEAVLFMDATEPNYFTPIRRALVVHACAGIALFISHSYN